MTILEIKSKIVEWIKTGIPKNVKSSNMRTLLSKLAIRVDVQEVGRLKILKATGNASESQEVGDKVTGMVEDVLIINAIYNGGNVNLLASYTVNNPLTLEDLPDIKETHAQTFTYPSDYPFITTNPINAIIDIQIEHAPNFDSYFNFDGNEVTAADDPNDIMLEGNKVKIIYK